MRFAGSLLTISIGKLVLGAGLGQIVSFLATPIIARLYGPQSFGEQTAIFSVVAPLVTMSSMAFPIAIVIARTNGEALALSRLAFFGTLVLAPLTTVFLFLEDMWLLKRLGLEAIGTFAILIPIIALLTTANMSAGYIMTRNSAFGRSAWASVSAAIAGNLTKLGLGLIWPGTLSLIIGNAVGYLVAPIFAFKLRIRMAHGAPRQSLNDLREAAREHRDFPLLRAPQNFVASVSMSIPILALTASFGVESAGFYAIALAIAGAPISLIGNAVQSVLYPHLTKANRDGENTQRLLLVSTLGLLIVGAPFFLLIIMSGPWLFERLLGAEWREAGVYSALLVPWLWMGLANRPAVSLIPVLRLQGGLLIYELSGTAIKIAAVMVALQFIENARWIVGIYSGVGALAYFILIAWVFWSNGNRMRKKRDEETG